MLTEDERKEKIRTETEMREELRAQIIQDLAEKAQFFFDSAVSQTFIPVDGLEIPDEEWDEKRENLERDRWSWKAWECVREAKRLRAGLKYPGNTDLTDVIKLLDENFLGSF